MQTSIASPENNLQLVTGLSNSAERMWQKQLRGSVAGVDELLGLLELKRSDFGELVLADSGFPLKVTRSFVNRMKVGEPSDPLLRQVLPLQSELDQSELTVSDPVGDSHARRVPGMLQKYHGRALFILSGTCAIHCRYCFRREYDYQSEPKSLEEWQPAFTQLEEDDSVEEVILSGGDPLMVSDQRLQKFIRRLEKIPHIQRLRIHSRLPIVLPSRVTDHLVQTLYESRFSPVMVVHANHPNEIVGDCSDALKILVTSGIPTLNQTVLMRGVNDNVDTLVELSRRLVNHGVMPYYLHQLDRVNGAMHFEVAVSEGKALISEMEKQLPGYAVPKYVQEVPGEASKTPL